MGRSVETAVARVGPPFSLGRLLFGPTLLWTVRLTGNLERSRGGAPRVEQWRRAVDLPEAREERWGRGRRTARGGAGRGARVLAPPLKSRPERVVRLPVDDRVPTIVIVFWCFETAS